MDIRLSSTAPPATPAPLDKTTPNVAAPVAIAAPAPAQVASAEPEPQPGADQLSEALKSINSALQARSQDLEFSVDSDSDRTIVKVTDKNTHEVIRQMPTKEALEISKALDRLQSLLIKQTA